MVVEETNTVVVDTTTEIPIIDLDLDALVEQFKNDPKALAVAVQKFYTEDQFESSRSLVLIQRQDGMWVVFEGMCNPRTHKFKVVVHISEFKGSRENPRRAPTQAVNFVIDLALRNQMPVWIP